MRPRALDILEESLANPPNFGTIDDLLLLWSHDDLIVETQAPKDFEQFPDFTWRVRGALGRALQIIAPQYKKPNDPYDRENAYQFLFEWNSPQIGETNISSPMAIRAELNEKRIVVGVRLFGMAGFHAPCVQSALIMAMENGVRIKNRGVATPFHVLDSHWRRQVGSDTLLNDNIGLASVKMLTPIIIRAEDKVKIDGGTFVKSAIENAKSVAPWMGLSLEHNESNLFKQINRLSFIEEQIIIEEWTRFSSRIKDTPIRVRGYSGERKIIGDLDEIAKYLTIAQMRNIGGSIAAGAGHFRVFFYS